MLFDSGSIPGNSESVAIYGRQACAGAVSGGMNRIEAGIGGSGASCSITFELSRKNSVTSRKMLFSTDFPNLIMRHVDHGLSTRLTGCPSARTASPSPSGPCCFRVFFVEAIRRRLRPTTTRPIWSTWHLTAPLETMNVPLDPLPSEPSRVRLPGPCDDTASDPPPRHPRFLMQAGPIRTRPRTWTGNLANVEKIAEP